MNDLVLFLKKVSSYQLFNNFFPGVVFVTFLEQYTRFEILSGSVLQQVFVYYFVGMVLSRVGSLLMEPWFKCWKIVEYAKYEDYNKARRQEAKLDILTETNNTFRTLASAFLCLMVASLIGECMNLSGRDFPFVVLAVRVVRCLFPEADLVYPKAGGGNKCFAGGFEA